MIRFDQIAYRELGAKARWYVGEATDALTCFEMEVKDCYQQENPHVTYDKVHRIFWEYITDKMINGDLPYITRYTGDDWNWYVEDGFDVKRSIREFNTSFDRQFLFNILENDRIFQFDVDKFKMFLSGAVRIEGSCVPTRPVSDIRVETVVPVRIGEKIPADSLIAETTREVPCVIDEIAMDQAVIEEKEESGNTLQPVENVNTATESSANAYIFKKTGTAWNLQFGNVVLRGVKDWLGMAYIKALLEKPDAKISVLELQRLVGEEVPYESSYGDDGMYPSLGHNASAWEILDPTAREQYRARLEEISIEIKDARNRQDQAKVKELLTEAKFIQKEVDDGGYKPKDPELEKNRKRVRKTIADAIANIRKLEEACGFNDKPISSHLRRHIKTGLLCSYTVPDNQLPKWRLEG